MFFTSNKFFPIFIVLITVVAISFLILGLSYLLSVQKPDNEKATTYECGFESFNDSRDFFDVRFYIIGLLFIIFDLEALLVYPWAVSLAHVNSVGFWTILEFLCELTIGFIYAWKLGALDWE
jgi:NADH-quinone oxidoreductase subunit A